MAARREGGNALAAVVIGALLIVAIAIGWFVWSGQSPIPTTPADLDVNLELPPMRELPGPAPMPNPEPTPLPTPATSA